MTVISDGKDRKSRPEQNVIDNFEEYLLYRVKLDNFLAQMNSNRPYPTVRMNPVKTLNSATSDLLQLTDLLLGATQSALISIANRPVKRELGRMVASWYQDLKNPPSKQQYKMHRKFSIWGFPDEKGEPFNRFPMAISAQYPDQLSLL